MELKLTSKERLVLYGLARYPGLSDIDLASRIGVDRSTIFKSKRKFRDWQLIRLMNVPAGEAVGAEIVTAVFAKYKPKAAIEDRKKTQAFDSWIKHPNCVFNTYTQTDSVSIIYSKSLTEFKSEFDPYLDEFNNLDMLEDVQCFHYPLKITSYSSDACMAVNDIFALHRDDIPMGPTPIGPIEDDAKLTEKDKMTLYAFIKYPMLSDLELSRRTGISRPTISGKRSKFFQSHLLSREAYVDWKKICCELITFYKYDIKESGPAALAKVNDAFRSMGAPLFCYLQPGQAFGAFLSSSYPELKKRMDAGLRQLAEVDLFDKRPMLVIMPLDEMGSTKMDYAPMVAKMLNISKWI